MLPPRIVLVIILLLYLLALLVVLLCLFHLLHLVDELVWRLNHVFIVVASTLIIKMLLLFLYYTSFSIAWSVALHAFFTLFILNVPVVNIIVFETVSVEKVFEYSS